MPLMWCLCCVCVLLQDLWIKYTHKKSFKFIHACFGILISQNTNKIAFDWKIFHSGVINVQSCHVMSVQFEIFHLQFIKCVNFKLRIKSGGGAPVKLWIDMNYGISFHDGMYYIMNEIVNNESWMTETLFETLHYLCFICIQMNH